MPTPEQLLLAVLSGIGFGVLMAWLRFSCVEVVLGVVLLYTMLSGPQFIYRHLAGVDVVNEVIGITIMRALFLASALVAMTALRNSSDSRWQ